MRLIDGVPVYGRPDAGALTQIKRCALTADRVALMADNHKGYAVPIGGVVAYRDAVSPSGVGYDIGCGNKAVRLNLPGEYVRTDIKRIMDDIWRTISFGVGRKNAEAVDDPIFHDADPGWATDAAITLIDVTRAQLGTVGSGNHYVDVFIDELDRPWVGVHFGSRGLGHKIATWFLKAAGATDGMDVDPCVLPVKSDLGEQYLSAMRLAGRYAYVGRNWVCSRVAKLIHPSAEIVEEVHNHHNFAWKETHGSEELWVVRKGATPAFPGQRGFVGATMGEAAVIIEGVEHKEAVESLYSTIHGAGRIMGRLEARGKIDRKTGKVKRAGKITAEMMEHWVTSAGIELRGAGLDESPDCYKRLDGVLDAHAGTIKILHTLKPIGVAMAAANEFDPYKD